jgi:hypothetical protein
MEERGNKTIICSVFFLDIVEYSKKSVSGQISLKERFNVFLSIAIRDVPNNDRIILDTGDGAAISFLGDVEDALRAALSMRGSLLSEEGLRDPALLVRMGINLGPVRLVKDINGQPNIVGDGINVAQRVMGFADPGQILVSRSYYDAASRLSQEYAGMFHFEGSRTDKHVREHEVYAIGYPGDVDATQQVNALKQETKISKALANFSLKSKAFWNTLVVRHNELTAQIRETFSHASKQKKALYVGLVAMPFILLLVLVIKLAHKPETPLKEVAKVAEVHSLAPVDVTQSSVPLALAAPAAVSAVPNTVTHTAPAHEQKPASQQQKKPKKDKKKEIEKKAAQTTAKEKTPARGPTGTVFIAIKPWGEVYLDGKWVDVSPPLTKFLVTVGSHVVEVRNTTFPVYKQSIKVNAGDKINVVYKFSN